MIIDSNAMKLKNKKFSFTFNNPAMRDVLNPLHMVLAQTSDRREDHVTLVSELVFCLYLESS